MENSPFIASPGQGLPPSPRDLCLVQCGTQLLHAQDASSIHFPSFEDLGSLASACEEALELGSYGSLRCFALSLSADALASLSIGNIPFQWSETRALLSSLDATQLHAVSAARHLLWWKSNYRFCPRCAGPLQDHPHERALSCAACSNTLYPVIAPAIIVAISKGSTLLLAHNKNFPGNRHSVIAGFAEAGETLEQCVAREVREEVGIEVDNICYVKSQAWPFPNSLMLGFTAEWKAGEIQVDGQEITSAAWFDKSEPLPDLPPPGSIARHLIDKVLG